MKTMWPFLLPGLLGLALALAGVVVPLTEVTVERAVASGEYPYVLAPAYYHDVFSQALPLKENWPVVHGKWVFIFALNTVPCLLLALFWRSRWAAVPLLANAAALMAAFVVVDPANQIAGSGLIRAEASTDVVSVSSTAMLIPAGSVFSGLAALAMLAAARREPGDRRPPSIALAVMLAGVAIAVSGLFLPLACTEAFHRDGPVISVCASYFTALRGSILPDNWPVENGLWVVAATSLVGLAVAAFAVFKERRWLSSPLALVAAGLLLAAVVVTWPNDDGDSDTSVPENSWGLAVVPVGTVIVAGGAALWLVRESALEY